MPVSSATPICRENDVTGHRPTTPEEIAAHNARILADLEEKGKRSWAHLEELAKGRDPSEPKQRASARRR